MTPLWKKNNNIQVVALEILMVKLGTLLNIKKKKILWGQIIALFGLIQTSFSQYAKVN